MDAPTRARFAFALLAAAGVPAFAQDAAAPAAPPEFRPGGTIRKADGMVVTYYKVNYVDPAILKRELDRWKTPGATVEPQGAQFDPAPSVTPQGERPKSGAPKAVQNVLRIEETEDNLPVLLRVLDMVDIAQPQVLVEARVLEITFSDELRAGIRANVSRPVGDTFFRSLDFQFPNRLDAQNFVTGTFRHEDKYLTFDYVVDLAEAGATARVLATPQLYASQGETAVIKVGELEPFVQQNIQGTNVVASTQFKDVGLRLEVQPILIGRDGIRARIQAEVSRLSDFRVTATSSESQVVNPVISSRNADTVVTVPDGETVVIGGLEQTEERDARTGLPILKDVPVLGWVFGSTTKRELRTELIFWITLTIQEKPEDARVIVPPGERARE